MTEQALDSTPGIEGEWYDDRTMRTLYATDASAYREMPQAVAIPKNTNDLKKLIDFARKTKSSLIPRTAGTSLYWYLHTKGRRYLCIPVQPERFFV